MPKDYKERLTANANDFDGIVMEMLTELETLRIDAKMLDWLGSPENTMATVELPQAILEKHDNIRDAITTAMWLEGEQ